MDNSFCQLLQTISEENLCRLIPPPPFTTFPNVDMTCVFEIPKHAVPDGLGVQYIFVGSYNLSLGNLDNNDIAGVLNVAYDVNDDDDLQVQDGTFDGKPLFKRQLSKVGLVDGPENDMMTAVAALYMADQLLNFPTPQSQTDQGMVNIIANGNLLIHCHDGGSRSVTITALYIYYKFYAGSSTNFEEVYRDIICYRWDKASNHHPTVGICNTAFQVLNTFEQLFPIPKYKS